jgi:hypothetical protein
VTDRTAFGEITITEVFCRDAPPIDTSSWWGWNLRTLGPDTVGADSEGRMFLPDLASGAADTGLSLALNNSTSEGINESEIVALYGLHLPFVQTPTLGTNLLGEISFKARRYDVGIAQPAVLRLYGSTSGQLADKWVPLADFIVTNDFYGPYSYKTQPGETYMAFRLAVPGVEEVIGTELARYLPDNYGYDAPPRVLLDEVLVSEALATGQDHADPSASSILVTFMLDNDFGHITHTVGGEVDGTNSQIVVLQKGNVRGTNVIYRVDPWFELGEVTTNGVSVQPLSADAANRLYTVNVGKGASSNFTVVGAARVKESLRLLGVDDANPYKKAIIDWLTKRRTLKGESWANPDSDEFRPAKFWELGADKSAARDMTVNEMYWLDMDPTVGDLYLRGGFDPSGPPMPHMTADGGENVRMKIALYVTNATEDADNPWYAQPAWSPYALRGLAPGESSLDYSEDVEWNWTSATFKVSAIINNGHASESNLDNWVPLRFFVFHEDSFDPVSHATGIEIVDPLSDESPAACEEWREWIDENAPGTRPIYYRWFIDRRRIPFDAEVLQQENYY